MLSEQIQNTRNESLDSKEKNNYLRTNYANKKSSTQYDFQLIKQILQMSNVKDGAKVLDLACGTGSFKRVFESFNFSYCGVDIDNNDSLNGIFKCDIGNQSLPFENNSFDVVFFKMGIEHLSIKEISSCLSEALRVLKSQGNFIVITPDWEWTYKFFYEEYTHQTPFTPSSLRTALRMSNFEVVFCESFIQLPIVWKFPILKIVSNLASLLYPLTKKKNKFIKFSKERCLLAIAKKCL